MTRQFMRFLADESCDFAVVRALRREGHDVLAAAEALPAANDQSVLAHAHRDARILLTEDRDFGRWVYASRQECSGVLDLRYTQRSDWSWLNRS